MLFGLEERAGDRSGPESPQRRRLLKGLAALAAVASVCPSADAVVAGGGRGQGDCFHARRPHCGYRGAVSGRGRVDGGKGAAAIWRAVF